MQKKLFSCLAMALFFVFALYAPDYGMSAQQKVKKKITGAGSAPTQRKETAETVGSKSTSGSDSSPGEVNARAAILMEVSSGTVLFEQNADEVIEPASFTKVMSLYLIFEGLQQGRVNLSDEFWVSEAAWRTGGSKMFVGLGTKVPLEELIKGIAVVSGNDACVTAAEHMYGSTEAFVDAMNRKAQELGMTQTHFMNPHGLPAAGQVTSARDMALMDAAYLRKFPESIKFHSMREYAYNSIVQHNRNHLLLKDESVDGLKTGFVDAAGYHLAATAKRDGMRLLAVVMGAKTPGIREREAQKLLNYGFRQYTLVQPFPDGKPISTAKIWKGAKDQLDLYPSESPTFLISNAQKKQLRWEVTAPSELTAPISAKQSVGEVVFYVSDQEKRKVGLWSLEEIPLGPWHKRIWHGVVHLGQIDYKLVGGVAGGIVLLTIMLLLISRRRRRHSF
jgi:D-alanyl-D-alanine carboxypeptidase (penicillin-binding protein 5/6)